MRGPWVILFAAELEKTDRETAMARGDRMDVSSDVTSLERISHEIFEAIRTKDVARLGAMLADDFVYQTPGAADVGRDAFLAGIEAIDGTIEAITGEDLRVRVVARVGIVTGIQRATVLTPAGDRVRSSVAFTDVFEFRGAGWVLVLAYGVDVSDRG